ncbi:MAG TPA: type II toxin-antitoxin system PemK/MazF family toxin [Verrucomicrobiota bacterium]|nr:type II toxin-antitoxin system PemK/MazF family toxin [Verrucomicrobiota bacterium]HRZ37367.1 type II toxin-antitoxin system PemK/MazF family toxin [Candidatus Paceibacterota bacterium]HRZ55391.1 type II toxin-antitoxin system PemK/MazF family toxin [Candidatus Paceibacterota bacterium]
MKRYDICIARLDPVQGSEMGKTRPVVIVSDDLRNQLLQTVAVCPLTRQLHPAWRSRLQVRCAGQTAEIAVDQIRVLNRTRLARKIAQLSARDADTLRRLISEMYGEP